MFDDNKCGQCGRFRSCKIVSIIDPKWNSSEKKKMMEVLVDLPACHEFKNKDKEGING